MLEKKTIKIEKPALRPIISFSIQDQNVKSIQDLTMEEIRWVWTVVNASQVSLSEKLQKIQDNFTQQVNVIRCGLSH